MKRSWIFSSLAVVILLTILVAFINTTIDMILSGASNIAGDVNSDGEVNIADINTVTDIILTT